MVVIVVLRFGLVAGAISISTATLLASAPITTDISAWYAGSGLMMLLAVVALAAFGFHTSLGGQKLLDGKLLEG